MTTTASSPSSAVSRTRWLRIAGATWLLLISAAAIVSSVAVFRLTEQMQGNLRGTQVGTLAERVARLEDREVATRQEPASLSQAAFADARRALEERLVKLEQAQDGGARADALQSLQARVAQVETRLERARHAAAPLRQRRTAADPHKAAEPTFRILGVELRGGERFLSIALSQTQSLASVRLLRVGEAEGAWRLEAIAEHAAVFRMDDQVRRLTMP